LRTRRASAAYRVVYVIIDDAIDVLAVAHANAGSPNPGKDAM
jgi:hypothetical protein